MDYKEKYEMALERARVWKEKSGMPTDKQGILDDIFPELAEPEDEKIRKGLIKYFKNFDTESLYAVGLTEEEILAWLEKQGKSYTKRDVDDAWLKGMCDAKRELEKQGDSPIKWNKNTKDCKPKVSHSVLMKTTHGIAEGEWQGEHWHQYRWAALVRDADVLSWMELSDLEKQSEQKSQRMISAEAKEAMYGKPSDKVEPKFKVGDWVANDYCVGKVVALTDDAYLLDSEQGIPFSCEHNAHLWTIQDAKDGDVIACENGRIGIFKCLNDNLFSSYCFIDNEGWFCGDKGQMHMLDTIICGEIYPATKEQRDLLFSKMNEAGYVWDADKKELKKIEQKSAEWSEEDKERLSDAIFFVREYQIPTRDKRLLNAAKEAEEWLKSLKERIGG